MRIFCAIEYEPYPGNHLWHNNMVAALRDLGHDVVLFHFNIDAFHRCAEIDHADSRKWVNIHRPALEKALLEQIETAHRAAPVDVFLSYFYSAHCTAPTIMAIRAKGIKTINWYCNASYQLHLVADLAPAYDLCMVPEKERLEDYRRLGANPVYCQEAANPRFYKELNLPKDLGLVFIGASFANRAAYCRALYDARLPVDVWGNAWSNPGGPLSAIKLLRFGKRQVERLRGKPYLPLKASHGFCLDEELVRIYNRAKIVLGFGVQPTADFQSKPVYQVRLRDFEAPMCGAFYLTEHQDELSEFFEIGREIETFRSQAELLDKARFYLSNDEARDRIRHAGHARALRDHTWQQRLTMVLSHLS
jgi:spore maturation protein CgeB